VLAVERPSKSLPRRHARLWAALSGEAEAGRLSAAAETIAQYIQEHGASFFDELMAGTGLLRSQVEEALAELVARGLANSDSFAGLRTLLVPASERRSSSSHRRRSP